MTFDPPHTRELGQGAQAGLGIKAINTHTRENLLHCCKHYTSKVCVICIIKKLNRNSPSKMTKERKLVGFLPVAYMLSGHSLSIIDYCVSAIAPCLSRQIFSPTLVLGLYVKRQIDEKRSLALLQGTQARAMTCQRQICADELPFFSSSSEVS